MTLICPCCMEEDATITLDLTDGDSLHCESCNADYAVADVQKVIDSWSKLLGWLAQHPARTAPQMEAA
jgi:hypothetical protein